MKNLWARAALALALLLPGLCLAAGPLGAAALRARYDSMAPQLAKNQFGGPLVLLSQQASGRIEGEIFAVLSYPLPTVSAALSDPAQWCDILILHLNTKYCRRQQAQGTTTLDLRVGSKNPQEITAASRLDFIWQAPQVRSDYLLASMEAPDGPFDTHGYQLLVEAVALDGNRTFLHMAYALTYGGASAFAMNLYLGTVARDKLGFTRIQPSQAGDEGYVGGQRGVVERNTMRYYLAIDAYLDSLAAPPAQQLEHRLQGWFDATEKYPRQLHEVERDAYLRMKRDEVERQGAAR